MILNSRPYVFRKAVISGGLAWIAPVLISLAISVDAFAAEIESNLARGGRLYDKWFAEIEADVPTGAHPSYPAEGKYYGKKGSDHRCKECHGWDYLGKDGAYAKGKHFTGIEGIDGMAGSDVAAIIAVLKDKTHGFGDKMGEQDLSDLALFVKQGQLDFDRYIDRQSKSPQGDKEKGEAYYNTICARCHGEDGRQPKEMDKSLGKQMGNPWEVMHKIQNGQPDSSMPALRALDIQITVDIMAHMATLPKDK